MKEAKAGEWREFWSRERKEEDKTDGMMNMSRGG